MTLSQYNEIIAYLRGVIEGTEFQNHLFSVGGCERDKALQHMHPYSPTPIKDIDLVLDLPDGGLKFADWLYIKGLTTNAPVIYENFGTAMFHLKAFPTEEIEAVQTRKESYRDNKSRNPETSFGTLEEDCKRRDFTINAIYHNISTGEDLDLTGRGLSDLEDGIIMATDDPDIIFYEDPLRILRAIRFSCVYNFEIEENTYAGVKKHVERLSIISNERITEEFNKIITSEKVMSGIATLINTGIFQILFPEIKCPDCVLKNIHHKLSSRTRELDATHSIISFLASMVYGIDEWETILRRMKYSLEIINGVKKIYECNGILKGYKNLKELSVIRHIQYVCGTEDMFYTYIDFLTFFKSLNGYDIPGYAYPDMCGYKLPINGFDIMEHCGISSGVEVKKKLDIILNEAFKHGHLCKEECFEILDKKESIWSKFLKLFK